MQCIGFTLATQCSHNGRMSRKSVGKLLPVLRKRSGSACRAGQCSVTTSEGVRALEPQPGPLLPVWSVARGNAPVARESMHNI